MAKIKVLEDVIVTAIETMTERLGKDEDIDAYLDQERPNVRNLKPSVEALTASLLKSKAVQNACRDLIAGMVSDLTYMNSEHAEPDQ